MSWDADYYAETVGGPEVHVGGWNYTHNTSRMIYAVLRPGLGGPWWAHLSGTGEAGLDYLNRIISGLEAEPERFRAMNPPNGWGDYDRLLVVLHEMRDACTTYPVGRWEVSG